MPRPRLKAFPLRASHYGSNCSGIFSPTFDMQEMSNRVSQTLSQIMQREGESLDNYMKHSQRRSYIQVFTMKEEPLIYLTILRNILLPPL